MTYLPSFSKCLVLLSLACLLALPSLAQSDSSGNPVFPGWYADPEGIIFDDTYWICPTYSAPFDEQVFLDAFSSPDLKHWSKHPRILDTAEATWAKRAMWAPAIVKKDQRYFLFFAANDIQSNNEEAIAKSILRRQYEINYLDARKQVGKIRAERLFPQLNTSNRRLQPGEAYKSSNESA